MVVGVRESLGYSVALASLYHNGVSVAGDQKELVGGIGIVVGHGADLHHLLDLSRGLLVFSFSTHLISPFLKVIKIPKGLLKKSLWQGVGVDPPRITTQR
jgi:hypothetical protein